MPTHTQLPLLPGDPPSVKRVRSRRRDPQLALFPGSETLSALRYRGRPLGPNGPPEPFTLRVQDTRPAPGLPLVEDDPKPLGRFRKDGTPTAEYRRWLDRHPASLPPKEALAEKR